MVPIPDERLEPLARTVGAAKVTPATLQLVEVAGTGPAMLGNLRKMDALLGVVDGFSGTGDPEADRESLALELLIADRDHVERRLERVRSQAKSGDPRLRDEVATLERALAHLEAGRPLSDFPEQLPPELEPLTTKPLVVVVNGAGGSDLKLEAELRDLDEAEAAELREGPSRARLGPAQPVRGRRPDHVLHRGRQGDAGLDAAPRRDGAGCGGVGAHRSRPRLHPLRGDSLGRAGRGRLARRGRPPRAATRRRQDVRRRGRRRAERPLRRLAATA